MNAFVDEVKRLFEGQWVAQSAVKSLEAFHKAAIAQAVKEERERIWESVDRVVLHTLEAENE